MDEIFNVRVPTVNANGVKLELVCGKEHFENLLRRYIGDDAIDCLNAYYYPADTVPEGYVWCVGECEKMYALKESQYNYIKDIRDDLKSIDVLNKTKSVTAKKLIELINRLEKAL